MLADSGCIAIVALISPLMGGRTAVRQRHAETGVASVEMYTRALLSGCEARAPKRLYRRPRTGEIPEFTGIDSPYAEPEGPDIRLGESNPPEVVERVITRLLAEEAR